MHFMVVKETRKLPYLYLKAGALFTAVKRDHFLLQTTIKPLHNGHLGDRRKRPDCGEVAVSGGLTVGR